MRKGLEQVRGENMRFRPADGGWLQRTNACGRAGRWRVSGFRMASMRVGASGVDGRGRTEVAGESLQDHSKRREFV